MLRLLLTPLILALSVLGAEPAPAPAGPPTLTVAGNRLVEPAGNTVRLLGVNRVGPEYACTYGEVAPGPVPGHPGYNPLQPDDAAAIASWHPTAVRVPLNEDCWLGRNGMPAAGLTAPAYREAIVDYVGDLHAEGLYAILDLHWSNPLGLPDGEGLHPMPDAGAPAFWRSVAKTFAADGAVVFDLFNEPYDPSIRGDPSHPVGWSCWRDGGCSVPAAPDTQQPDPNQTYTAVGMQRLVGAIRATGARQPIMVGGLEYANDLSGWLAYKPSDPLDSLVASFHNYSDQECNNEACWNETIAPVAASVPVITGEFGEFDCPPSGSDPNNFDNTYMRWADTHGIGYLGWGWVIPDPPRDCSTPYLISDYEGTPVDPNGVALHDRLATRWIAATLTRFLRRAVVLPSAKRLLRADGWQAPFTAPSAGLLQARWKLPAAKRAPRLLARAHHRFARPATGTISLRLTAAGRRRLARHPHLAARLTVSFRQAGGVTAVRHRLTSPARF